MASTVSLKGTTYGISVIIDKTAEFPVVCKDLADRFAESAKWFKDATMVIIFEGRELTEEEERVLLDVIANNSSVQVACVIQHGTKTEELHKQALENQMKAMEMAAIQSGVGQFYKGNLRSGQILETETSIIIIGDVNQGATVTSKGNVIILGSLFGVVSAGVGGNDNAFVLALEMDPVQIRIADAIGRAPDRVGKKVWKREKERNPEPKVAFRSGNDIVIEPVSRTVLNDIQI